jgi:hypothetical protein
LTFTYAGVVVVSDVVVAGEAVVVDVDDELVDESVVVVLLAVVELVVELTVVGPSVVLFESLERVVPTAGLDIFSRLDTVTLLTALRNVVALPVVAETVVVSAGNKKRETDVSLFSG